VLLLGLFTYIAVYRRIREGLGMAAVILVLDWGTEIL
jgi:hypothetical protein